ncbi:MAG: DUF1801 domain-containing protein [Candidatus Sericytochromatia bacterium]
MAKNKTQENANSIKDFISSIKDEKKQTDTLAFINIVKELTNLEPKMWGTSIIGFGSYHYKYESGREGDSPLVALSPRSNAITFYLSCENEKKEALLEKLGKYKAGKGCVYIKNIEDIDINILKEIINEHISYLKALYP